MVLRYWGFYTSSMTVHSIGATYEDQINYSIHQIGCTYRGKSRCSRNSIGSLYASYSLIETKRSRVRFSRRSITQVDL
jgi:hypothetical protein